jgi:FixJ family two-component response regulator
VINAKPTRIAIVDDEEHIRRALRRLLNSAGYEVELFAGGEEFLASLAGQRPDCVVLDLHMPQTDGFAVLDQLSQQGIRIPIVVITGYETTESHRRVAAAGVTSFLRKPIDGQQLINSIQEVMQCP